MIYNLILNCFRCFGLQNVVIEDQTEEPDFNFHRLENLKKHPEQIKEYAEEIITKISSDIYYKNHVRQRIRSASLYEKVNDAEQVSLFIQSILHEDRQDVIDRMTQYVETLYRLK